MDTLQHESKLRLYHKKFMDFIRDVQCKLNYSACLFSTVSLVSTLSIVKRTFPMLHYNLALALLP